MKKTFASLHARAFCHATEDLDKVKKAMENALGQTEIKVSKTEGVHGNPIAVLEASVVDSDGIAEFFGKLSEGDLSELLATLGERVDDGCNLFLRIDKQEAYKGLQRLATDGDVISIRLRVRAYPAKREIAYAAAKKYVEEELLGRSSS